MQIRKGTTQQGYVTISATLIVSAILVLIISQSVLHSATSMQSLVEVEQALKAQARGRACAELVWQRVVTDVNYVGVQEIEVQGGVCTIVLVDSVDIHHALVRVETREGSMLSHTRLEGDMEEPDVTTMVWSNE